MTHRVPIDRAGRSRSRRAILAGGAVLGVGAAATLAAWTDNTWVESTFTTTPFNIEAAVDPDGKYWQDYSAPNGGTLGFSVASGGMLPGDSVYAPLNLKLTGGGTADMLVRLSSPPSAPSGGNNVEFFNALTLTLYEAAPANCSAAGIGSTPPIGAFSNAGLTQHAGADLVTLPGNGDPVGVCFKITLSPSAGIAVQNGTSQLLWTLQGELKS